jgi:hypothetical protein
MNSDHRAVGDNFDFAQRNSDAITDVNTLLTPCVVCENNGNKIRLFIYGKC